MHKISYTGSNTDWFLWQQLFQVIPFKLILNFLSEEQMLTPYIPTYMHMNILYRKKQQI